MDTLACLIGMLLDRLRLALFSQTLLGLERGELFRGVLVNEAIADLFGKVLWQHFPD